MARRGSTCVWVVMAMYCFTAGAAYGETASAGNKSLSPQEPFSKTKSGTIRDSKQQSKEEPVQDDVQSRGLFSKKKKKKSVGGAAGHENDTAEQPELPMHNQSGEKK